jgi:hypothetical protein
MFSSKSFIVFVLTFASMNHYKFILYMVLVEGRNFFPNMDIQLF